MDTNPEGGISGDYFDQSEKFETFTGRKYAAGDIGDASVFIVKDDKGITRLINGAELRVNENRINFDSALYFTWPTITNGKTINIPGYNLVNHLEFTSDGQTLIFDSMPEIINHSLNNGHIATKGMFQTDTGLYIIQIPPGILISQGLWEQYRGFLEHQYGKISEMAFGDFDFGAYLGYSDKEPSENPVVFARSQIAMFSEKN